MEGRLQLGNMISSQEVAGDGGACVAASSEDYGPAVIDSADQTENATSSRFENPPDNETFDGWTVNQLKCYLRARGAHVSGRRASLLER